MVTFSTDTLLRIIQSSGDRYKMSMNCERCQCRRCRSSSCSFIPFSFCSRIVYCCYHLFLLRTKSILFIRFHYKFFICLFSERPNDARNMPATSIVYLGSNRSKSRNIRRKATTQKWRPKRAKTITSSTISFGTLFFGMLDMRLEVGELFRY